MKFLPEGLAETGAYFFALCLVVYILFVLRRMGRGAISTLDDEVNQVNRNLWIAMFILFVAVLGLFVPFLKIWDPQMLEQIASSSVVTFISNLFHSLPSFIRFGS